MQVNLTIVTIVSIDVEETNDYSKAKDIISDGAYDELIMEELLRLSSNKEYSIEDIEKG